MGKPSLAEVAILFISVGATVFAIVVAKNFPGTGADIFKEAVLFGSGGGITYALARWSGRIATGTHVGIPMMSISHSDLMPIRSERSDAGLSQCETVIGIRQEFC